MRIVCPYCGERPLDEFAYFGDANVERPDPARPDALAAFVDTVYLRDNPAGRNLRSQPPLLLAALEVPHPNLGSGMGQPLRLTNKNVGHPDGRSHQPLR